MTTETDEVADVIVEHILLLDFVYKQTHNTQYSYLETLAMLSTLKKKSPFTVLSVELISYGN